MNRIIVKLIMILLLLIVCNSISFAVGATKLQVLLPGEEGDPGSAPGGTGKTAAQPVEWTAGVSTQVVINAVDDNWNVIDGTPTVNIQVTINDEEDGYAVYNTSIELFHGTETIDVMILTAGEDVHQIVVTDSNYILNSSTSADFTVDPNSATKLLVVLEGESADPGSSPAGTGKTASGANDFTAGVAKNVTVNLVDNWWNTNDTDVQPWVFLSTAAASAACYFEVTPSSIQLVNGTETLSLTLKTATTEGWRITAEEITANGYTLDTSTSVLVNPKANDYRLQVLLPGETADPGSPTGKVAAPSYEATAGSTITITVRSVDDNWNLKYNNLPDGGVKVTTTDQYAIVTPVSQYLTDFVGTADFDVCFYTANSTWTIKAEPDTGDTMSYISYTSPHVDVSPDDADKKIQILLTGLGETPAPGTPSGKNAAPSYEVKAGDTITVTIRSVDRFWNVNTDNKPDEDVLLDISTSCYASITPATDKIGLDGTVTFDVFFRVAHESWTIKAELDSNPAYASDISPQVSVNPDNSVHKLQILLTSLGESPVPGSASGKTNASSYIINAGSTVTFTVRSVGRYWNLNKAELPNSGVSIIISTSSYGQVTPVSQTLSGATGEASFDVFFNVAYASCAVCTYADLPDAFGFTSDTSTLMWVKPLIVDVLDPWSEVTIPANGGYYNGSTNKLTTISGSADDDSSGIDYVEVKMKQQSSGKFYNSGNGFFDLDAVPEGPTWTTVADYTIFETSATWTFDAPDWGSNLNTYYIWAKATDKTGNFEQGVQITSNTFTIDTGKPESVAFLPDSSSADNFYNDLTTISGTALDDGIVEEVKISIRDVSRGTTYWTGGIWTDSAAPIWKTATGQDDWTYSFTNNNHWVSGHEYWINTRAYDLAGNYEIGYATQVFVYDTEPPESAVTNPNNGAYYNTSNIFAKILGTAADETVSAEGIVAGVKETSDRVEFTLKRLSDNQYWSGGGWIGETWLEPLSYTHFTTSCTWEYGNLPTWSSELSGSSYTITTRSIDKTENQVVSASSVTFTLDKTNPTSTITYPQHGSEKSSVSTISGTASDVTSGIDHIDITVQELGGDYLKRTTWDFTANGSDPLRFIPVSYVAGDWWIDSSTVPFENSKAYEVIAYPTDKANNQLASATSIFDYVSPCTHFNITINDGVSIATSNVSCKITVQALDAGEQIVSGYEGTIRFTCDDFQVSAYSGLPADDTLTNGAKDFIGGYLPKTVGTWKIEVEEVGNPTIHGEVTVQTVVGALNGFVFNKPAGDISVWAGKYQAIEAHLTDLYGNSIQEAGWPCYLDIVDFNDFDVAIDSVPGTNVITSTFAFTDVNGYIGIGASTDTGKIEYYVSSCKGDYARIRISTGTGAFMSQDSGRITAIGGEPYKLVYISSPTVASAGTITDVITVMRYDMYDNITESGFTLVAPYSNSPSTTTWMFYGDNIMPYTPLIGRSASTLGGVIQIASGNNSASYYYKDSKASHLPGQADTWEIEARSPQLSLAPPPVLNLRVDPGVLKQLAFTTSPQTLKAGVTSQVMLIEAQDSNGNPTAVTKDIVCNLESDSAAYDFSTDYGINALPHPSIMTISTNTYCKDIWYRDDKPTEGLPHNLRVEVSTSVPANTPYEYPNTTSAQQVVTVMPADVYKIVFINLPYTVDDPLEAGATSYEMIVQTQDKHGNAVPFYDDIMIRLDSEPLGQYEFSNSSTTWFVALDTTPWPSSGMPIVWLSSGTSTVSFFYKNYSSGSWNLVATEYPRHWNEVAQQTVEVIVPPIYSNTVNDLSANATGDAKIQLDWINSTSTDVVKYNIYYSSETVDINYSVIIDSVAYPTETYTSPTLVDGVTYKFVVRALNNQGYEEKNTNIVSATAVDELSNLPKAVIWIPQNGKRIAGRRVTVMAHVDWSDIANVKEVRLQCKTVTDSEWGDIPPSQHGNTVNPDASFPYFLHWDVIGLPEREYNIRAIAYDLEGTPDPNPSFITVTVDYANPDILEDIDEYGCAKRTEKIDNGKNNIVRMGGDGENNVTEVIIPQGALDVVGEASLSIIDDPVDIPDIPSNRRKVGKVKDIKLGSGVKLTGIATIKIPYNDANDDGIEDESGVSENNLKPYTSPDANGSWEEIAEGNYTIYPSSNIIAINTSHFSLYTIMAESTEDFNVIAYPNPFGEGGTSFIYTLGEEATVNIKIYTVSGRLIRNLFDGTRTADYHDEDFWDGKDQEGNTLANGVYIYKLTATPIGGGETVTKTGKIVIMR